MGFKNFDDIGDAEPRAWSQSVGTKFGKEEDEEDDEIPVPYCDEFDEDEEDEEEDEAIEETETETETETESIGSTKSKNPLKRTRHSTASALVFSVVLQEESDFMVE